MKKFLAFFLLIAADFWISLAVNFVLAKIIEFLAFSIVLLLFAIPLQLAAAVVYAFEVAMGLLIALSVKRRKP